MQAKHVLPVFILVVCFPYFLKSQCNLSVSLGPDVTMCQGQQQTLMATAVGGVEPVTFAWSHTPVLDPSVSVSNSGNYSVWVTDANGCKAADTVLLTTLDTATFTLEIRPDTALYLSCNNKNVIVKALPDGVVNVSGFKWNTGAIDFQFITVYQTGTYEAIVTASNGCESKKSLTVTENKTPPNISILPVPNPAIITCNRPEVLLDAISTTPAVTFRWNTNQTNTTIAVTTAGIYSVTAQNSEFSGNGCTATTQIEVIDAKPKVSLGPDIVACNGQTTVLTATITGGVAPFTYFWSNNLGTAPSVSVTNSGNYSVTITDANGCSAADTIVVTNANSLIVNVGADVSFCKGLTKTLNAEVLGGTTPYAFLWSNNLGTDPSVSVSNSGNYSVTVTDKNGCSGTDAILVTVLDTAAFTLEIRPDTALYLSCNNKNVIVKALPDGVVNVSGFKWNTGAIDLQFITVYQTGIYEAIVTASNGCESKKSIGVTENKTPPNVSILPVPNPAIITCNRPEVLLDAISTTPAVTFKWNTNQTNTTIAVTTAGIYSVTAQNSEFSGNGCTATAQIEVTDGKPKVSLGPDIILTAGQTATLTPTITGGIAPYSYLWSTNLGTNPSVSTTYAGTYSVTITDANGCTASDTVVVTVNGVCSLDINLTQNNNFCFGSYSGSIYIGSINGGIAPYQYSFNDGASFSSTPYSTHLAAGTYKVVVKDINNCRGTKTVVITEGSEIKFTLTTTPTCNNTGTITISNVSGGNGSPYQYFITNLPFGHPYFNTWVTHTVFRNLAPNTYFVKVSDAVDCNSQPPISVVVGTILGFSATIQGNSTVCFGSTTPLTAAITGGTAPFTYSWIKADASTVTTSAIQAGVGNVFLTITDANGCTASAMKTITGVVGVAASIVGNTTICGNPNTTLTASGWEGTPPYKFVWSTGKTGTTNNSTSGISVNVGAGSHCVTVTDANGCSHSACKTVTASTLSATISGNLTCSATTTTLTASGEFGNAPYLYRWSTGSTTPTITASAGTYRVTVTDAAGCSVTKSTTLTAPSVLTLTLDSISLIKCNGGANGKIFTTVRGGVGSKLFTSDNFATSQNGSDFKNLVPNTYVIQVKDANNCLSNTISATITEPAALVFSSSKTDETCNDGNDGTITIAATGGVNPLEYSSNNGGDWQSTPIFGNLKAGNYRLKVRDANGCTTASQTVTITQPVGFSFGTVRDNVTCPSGNDGKIVVRNFSGGNGAPYQFSKNDGTTWQTDSTFNGLSAGTYNIKIRDVKGCVSVVRVVEVTQPTPITFATTVGNISCGFTSNGVIAVNSIVGGTPQYKYSRGGNFQSNANFTGLTVGTYPIQVRDSKGCLSAVKNVVVGNDCAVNQPLTQIQPTQLIPVVVARLSPNPASVELTVEVRSLNVRAQQFDFVDVLGKTVLSEKRQLESGANRLVFDVSNLPQGTYFIQTSGSNVGKNQQRSFVKM